MSNPDGLDECRLPDEVGFFRTNSGEGMCGGQNWPAKTGDRGTLTCRNLGPDPRIVDFSGLTPSHKGRVKGLMLRDLCACKESEDSEGNLRGCEMTDPSGVCVCKLQSTSDRKPGNKQVRLYNQPGKTCYQTCLSVNAEIAPNKIDKSNYSGSGSDGSSDENDKIDEEEEKKCRSETNPNNGEKYKNCKEKNEIEKKNTVRKIVWGVFIASLLYCLVWFFFKNANKQGLDEVFLIKLLFYGDEKPSLIKLCFGMLIVISSIIYLYHSVLKSFAAIIGVSLFFSPIFLL